MNYTHLLVLSVGLPIFWTILYIAARREARRRYKRKKDP